MVLLSISVNEISTERGVLRAKIYRSVDFLNLRVSKRIQDNVHASQFFIEGERYRWINLQIMAAFGFI